MARGSPDLRERYFGWAAVGLEGLEPCANACAEFRYCDAAVLCGKTLQASQGCAQQRCGACRIAALEMVEGRSDLDQGLEESLLRFIAFEPHGFPMFVRVKKLLIAIAAKAFRERSLCPVKRHRVFIINWALYAWWTRTCDS